MLRIEMGEIKVLNKQGEGIVYAENSDIWSAYEIFYPESEGYYDKKIIPPRLFCQLIIKREQNFYPNDGKTYIDLGYRFFQVESDSSEWVELTFESFQALYLEFKHSTNGRGERRYICKLAYEKIPKPQLSSNPNFEEYNKYLRVYYPDYIADDVGAAFALWTTTGEPVVLVRLKCGCEHGWDMVYPGEKDFVPLRNFSWRELDNFGDRFGKAEQIYPQEYFRECIGVRPKSQWAIWGGNRVVRIDNVPGPIAHEQLRSDDFWARAFARRFT